MPLQLLALLWLAARAATTAHRTARLVAEQLPVAVPLIDTDTIESYPADLPESDPLPEIIDRLAVVQEPRFVRRGKRYVEVGPLADIHGETIYRKAGRRYQMVRS